MIWTTESSTVLAAAPGYIARIPIEGGAIGGYWETGSFTIAMAPASIIAIAMTQAKTGRSRKKRDIWDVPYLATADWPRSAAEAFGAAGAPGP